MLLNKNNMGSIAKNNNKKLNMNIEETSHNNIISMNNDLFYFDIFIYTLYIPVGLSRTAIKFK